MLTAYQCTRVSTSSDAVEPELKGLVPHLTHWAETAAKFGYLSKPHEYWCSLDYAQIYTGPKTKCGHMC